MKKTILAGAGRTEVRIDPELLPMERFGSVHDAPNVRALLLKAEKGEFLLLSLEMTSLMGKDLDEVKGEAAEAAQVSIENVWVSVTHTFSVPHFLGGPMLASASDQEIAQSNAYKNSFLAAVRSAACTARESLIPVALSVCSGASAVNANRDMDTPQGWWIGINPTGACDRTLNVLRVDGSNGTPVAVVYNYGMQSSVLDNVFEKNGNRQISADLIGETSRKLETDWGGVAIFLPGASGNQCPRERARWDIVDENGKIITNDLGPDKGFEIVSRLGAELAGDVERSLGQGTISLTADAISMEHHRFACPKQVKQFDGFPVPTRGYTSIPDGTLETSLEILRIGNQFAIVAVLPELNSVTGLTIRHESPVAVTWVAQMINGGQKYMADSTSFDRGTYGAMNGFFDRGAAEILTHHVKGFLQPPAKQ